MLAGQAVTVITLVVYTVDVVIWVLVEEALWTGSTDVVVGGAGLVRVTVVGSGPQTSQTVTVVDQPSGTAPLDVALEAVVGHTVVV